MMTSMVNESSSQSTLTLEKNQCHDENKNIFRKMEKLYAGKSLCNPIENDSSLEVEYGKKKSRLARRQLKRHIDFLHHASYSALEGRHPPSLDDTEYSCHAPSLLKDDSNCDISFISNIIDFSNLENNTVANRRAIQVYQPENKEQISRDLKTKINHHENLSFFQELIDLNRVNIFSLSQLPGLYFIPNPFTPSQQRYWVKRCVEDYPIKTPTNVSNLAKIQKNLTNDQSQEFDKWHFSNMSHLRWASLGYHFQWTPRIYSDEHRGPFPQDLNFLIRQISSLVDYPSMEPQAAIINYYNHSKCMMGGHFDDAEEDMTQPIVSISFGNTIIFLIGGRTRDVEPMAIYVRSGDIVIMAGESRYSIHAVPKMFPFTSPKFLYNRENKGECKDECDYQSEVSHSLDDNRDWRDYIRNSRINVNARQVKRISSDLLFIE